MAENLQDQGDRTEDPTETKLRKAREEGDVASSKEAGILTVVFALMMIMMFVAPSIAGHFVRSLSNIFDLAPKLEVGYGPPGLGDLGGVVRAFTLDIAIVLGPVLLALLLAGLGAVALHGETVVTAKRIQPKWSKVSPVAGFKRVFSSDAMMEFAKSLLKVTVIAWIGYTIGWEAITRIWGLEGILPERLTPFIAEAMSDMLLATFALVLVSAIADNFWKRYKWRRNHMMTRREIQDEQKDSEGDPYLKGKRKQIQLQRSRRRIAQAVPKATVILTNPTHYAVALRYEPGRDMAPVCVAKGTDLLALKIREIARTHDVPIIEAPPLARALYASTEIDQAIPAEHWRAAAEIIGFLLDLRRKVRRPLPAGVRLRND